MSNNYIGVLYGKRGGQFFPVGYNGQDVVSRDRTIVSLQRALDATRDELDALRAVEQQEAHDLADILKANELLKLTVGRLSIKVNAVHVEPNRVGLLEEYHDHVVAKDCRTDERLTGE